MHQHEHQHSDQDPPDVAFITAQSKAHWDRSSTSYAEILIRRGLTEPNFRQVIDAVVKHCKPGVWVASKCASFPEMSTDCFQTLKSTPDCIGFDLQTQGYES